MPNTDQAGALIATLKFPVRAATLFLYVFFSILMVVVAIPIFNILSTPSFGDDAGARTVLVVCASFEALIATGLFVGLFLVGRRPLAMHIHQDALVLKYRTRVETLPWSQVVALKQVRQGRVPNHAVVFDSGRQLTFGLGSKAQEMARHIARLAALTWSQEPFFAERSPGP